MKQGLAGGADVRPRRPGRKPAARRYPALMTPETEELGARGPSLSVAPAACIAPLERDRGRDTYRQSVARTSRWVQLSHPVPRSVVAPQDVAVPRASSTFGYSPVPKTARARRDVYLRPLVLLRFSTA